MSKDKFAGKVYLELTFWSNVSASQAVLSRQGQRYHVGACPREENRLEDSEGQQTVWRSWFFRSSRRAVEFHSSWGLSAVEDRFNGQYL